jgi:urease beta subunit
MRRRLAIIAAVMALSVTALAIAFWGAAGDGQASAALSDLTAPVASVPASSAGTSVPVSWSAAALVPAQPSRDTDITYTVRVSSDGGQSFTAANGTCAGQLGTSVRGCDDTETQSSNYTFKVIAHLGGWTADSNSATVAVTTLTAPTINSKPAAQSATTAPSFAFTGGNGSGYECEVDLAGYSACSSPRALTGLSDASHTFTVRATSGAAHGPAAAYTWTIDSSAPSITSAPPATTTSSSASFTFNHSLYSSFQCRLDSAAFSPCSSPKAYSGLASGAHTFRATGLDAAGAATSVASASWTIAAPPVNTAPPTITGTAVQGQTLTAGTGTWSGSPTSYAYQWRDCTADGACTNIVAGTDSSYTLVAADRDYSLDVRVTASNADGSATAGSSRTAPVSGTLTPLKTYIAPGVNALARMADGSTIIGGSFTAFGTVPGNIAAVSASDDQSVSQRAVASGAVNAIVPDGSGGWYLGGSFQTIGSASRRGLAQINAAGNVTSWNPGVNNTVFSLAVSGSTVYVGGNFATLGGGGGGTASRSQIGAVDAATGAATGWNPGANGAVNALAVSGSTVYAGGSFTTLGGGGTGTATRTRIGAVDAATGAATSWDPGANNLVSALVVSGSSVYAGGSFTTLGGGGSGTATRLRIGALDASTGAATGWNPGANGTVNVLALSGSTLYAGGSFTSLGGGGTTSRSQIGAIDAATGAATGWNPGANGAVNALVVSGSTVYVGGGFSTLGGGGAGTSSRSLIGALDAATGAATSWSPGATGSVTALGVSGPTVFVGASAGSSIGATVRDRLAQVDAAGNLTSWDPGANGTVNTLVVSGSTVYAGGSFTALGGGGTGTTTRLRIGALDTATGAVTGWNPGANSTVNVLAMAGSTLYAGGGFTTLGGGGSGTASRSRIGAVDAGTGAATGWNPGANNTVSALAVSGSTLYAGGSFTTLGGGGSGTASRSLIGALDAGTGAATSWNPGANNGVSALAVSGSTVYVGGAFTTLGGGGSGTTSRSKIGAVDGTGAATSWNPGANSTVNALVVSGATVYEGGNSGTLGGGGTGTVTRIGVGAVDAVTGVPTNWNPGTVNSPINALVLSPGAPIAFGGGNLLSFYP